MVKKEVILSRLERIDEHLKRLSGFMGLSLQDYLVDWKVQDIVEYNLFQIVNHLIDIFEHIVVDDGLGMADSAYESVHIMTEKGRIDSETSVLMKKMIGFRNIVGHEYTRIDRTVVHTILMREIPGIREIVRKILEMTR